MQAFDSELVTAGVYVVVVVPVYLLLWRCHSGHCYAALAIAALILALCALTRSDTVRAWDSHPLHDQHAPTNDRGLPGDLGLVAELRSPGCATQTQSV